MANLAREDKEAIVQDLATVFNTTVQRRCLEQKQDQYTTVEAKPSEVLRWTAARLAAVVDFYMTPVLAQKYPDIKFSPLALGVNENPLASGELTAIDLIKHMERMEILSEAVPVLYRVMEETSKAHNVPFQPVYKAAKPKAP